MSWFGVLEHHARRTPDKPLAVFGDDVVTYRGMADWAAAVAGGLARARRRRRRRRRAALVQQHRVPGDDLRRQPPRRDRDADQLAAGGAGAAVHPRALRSPRARVRRRARRPRRTRRPSDLDGDLVRVCIVERRARGGWERFADLARRRPAAGACPVDGRRHPPADVHVGHDRAPEGRDDHPRQPGVEELRAHHRVRVHRRRRRPRVRPAVPRRRARPRHHHDDRGGRDDHHPPRVRRRAGRRRDRAVAGDHACGPRRRWCARSSTSPASSSATSRRCA